MERVWRVLIVLVSASVFAHARQSADDTERLRKAVQNPVASLISKVDDRSDTGLAVRCRPFSFAN